MNAAPEPGEAAATIVGAGSVGLALALRLARAGVGVLLVTRRPEAARTLAERGLAGDDPATGARVAAAVRASAEPTPRSLAPGPVFLCTRANAVDAVARMLAGTPAPLVTFQNDVASETAAARHHAPVIGGVWRETVTRRADDRVCLQLERPGRAVVGLHPHGWIAEVDAVAALLRRGDIDVSVSRDIARDKWLKLCVNLMSAPNALIRRSDHRTRAFVEIKARLLEEARAALFAAGIAPRSCDGRDRSLVEEIAWQRASLASGESARELPIYNQVWSALRHGASLEADAYHRRILRLAEESAIPAPVNARVLEVLLRQAASGAGPESIAAAEILDV